MTKAFFTYDQQIGLLESKNMLIPDKDYAKEILSEIGYFSLIGGYKHLFKNPTTKMYRDGVCFDDILLLYQFDEALRHIFLRRLLMIEKMIKNRIAYAFCSVHGENQSEYLNPLNYDTDPRKAAGISKLIGMLSKLATQPTDYPYINHHQTAHGNVPLWVLTGAITFGSMSKMFGFLPQSLQSQVCRYHPLNIRQLDQLLIILTQYRNACAHGERLFSHSTYKDIPDLPIHSKMHIPQQGNQYLYGKHDLFSVVIALKYLLSKKAFMGFVRDLSKEIELFSKKCNSLPIEELLESMGFPANWKSITRNYKL